MTVDIVNKKRDINLHTINVDELTYEEAYGLPVKSNDGVIVGFVSDVDENYIYMHIFDRDTLDIEQKPTSIEFINA